MNKTSIARDVCEKRITILIIFIKHVINYTEVCYFHQLFQRTEYKRRFVWPINAQTGVL